EERTIVRADITRIYNAFLRLVESARKLTADELAPIAQGKVRSGRQALERKLVDELGGLDAGLAKARALAGLSEKVPMREVRGPGRVIRPLAEPAPAAGWFGYLLEGLWLRSACPAAAGMQFLTVHTDH